MSIPMAPQPKWFSLSHHGRYRRLEKVRRVWCRPRARAREDIRGRVIHLEGAWINDVPSFYLALGEAINGPNGYFGAGLDALSDCLNGGFGILPPMTIYLSHFDTVRNALDGRAWYRFHAERDSSETDLEEEPFDPDAFGSYFDSLLEILNQGGAQLIPHMHEARS